MSLGRTEGMSTHSILTTSTFDKWIAEGTLVHLGEARRAVMLTSSNALSVDISNRIAALRKLIVQHLVVLNTSQSALLRLPREIVESIISYAASEQHVRKWVKLGHICSAFRGVLLGFHRLWADAVCSFSGGRHRDELLERAGPSAPLRLRVPADEGTSDASQFAIAHLDRAGALISSQTTFIKWFAQNVDFPTLPCLEEVNLKEEYDPIVVFKEPPRATPQLKRVKLTNVIWSFSAPNLTSLSIIFHRSTRVYSPSQLLDLLSQSNFLQVLRLEHCLPYFPDNLISENKTSLLSLRVLVVTDDRAYALQIWRLLAVPSSTQVIFNLMSDALGEPTHPDYTGPPCFEDSVLFRNHLENRQSLGLAVTGHYYSSLCLTVSSTPPSNSPQTAAFPPRVVSQSTLTLAYHDCYNDFENHTSTVLGDIQKDALHRVCTILNLFNVTHLSWMTKYSYDRADQWALILKDFTNVEYLDLSLFNQGLGRALHSPSTQTRLLLLPKLRELTVKTAFLESEGREDSKSQSLLVASLFAMLHSRFAQGRPLDVLRFLELYVQPSRDGYKTKATFINDFRARFPSCRLEIVRQD